VAADAGGSGTAGGWPLRRFGVPIGTPELLFAGVVLTAFLVGAVVLGRVAEVLNTCSTSRCAPTTAYVEPNIGAGLIAAFVTAVLLVLIGVLRDRRSD
jgi:hypothetical protein